jgi:hypothetical protein
MNDGFRVDLDDLRMTEVRILTSIEEVDGKKLLDVSVSVEAFGEERIGRLVLESCEECNTVIGGLVADVKQLVARLAAAGATYRDADEESRGAFKMDPPS